MRNRRTSWILAAAFTSTTSEPSVAYAGMPAIQFHDLARMRLEVISFFLLGFLVSSGVVFWIWNFLRKDFTSLPRLSFSRACGVVALWGLLFVVVLTMISGARELMTPGAWERNGVTYKLTEDSGEQVAHDSDDRQARESHLEQFYAVLESYAAAHGGNFPSNEEIEEVAGEHLVLPDGSGLRLIYLPDQTENGKSALLAYEPTVYGDQLLALFTDGEIRPMEFEAIGELQRGTTE